MRLVEHFPFDFLPIRVRTRPFFDDDSNNVVQSTTPALLRTRKYYYFGITQYFKVLLRTTKYYSGTIPYCKVQQRTTGTKNCKVLPVLVRLIVATHETSSALCGATLWDAKRNGTPIFMFDSGNTWNVVYIACSNLCYAKRNGMTTLLFDGRYMKRHLNDAKQQESLSDLTKYWACHEKWHSKISEKFSENGWSVIYKKWQLNFTKYCRMPRKLNVNPTSPNWMFNLIATSPNSAPATKLTVELHQDCNCHENWMCNSIFARATKSVLFCDSIILLRYQSLNSTILLLYYSLTLLVFCSIILWLYYSFTLLFFDSVILLLQYSLTLMFFYSTILLFFDSISLLFYCSLILLLVTPRFFDFTSLLLNYVLLHYSFMSLLLQYSLTLRSRSYTPSFSTKLPFHNSTIHPLPHFATSHCFHSQKSKICFVCLLE